MLRITSLKLTENPFSRRAAHEAGQRLARALLREEGGGLLGFDAQGKPLVGGKPLVEGSPRLSLSLTHSRDYVIGALTDLGAIGIDLEVHREGRRFEDIAAFAFGPLEQERVATFGAASFYRLWTLREAYAKATGIGWSLLVDGVERFGLSEREGVWRQALEGRNWWLGTAAVAGDFTLALALAPNDKTLALQARIATALTSVSSRVSGGFLPRNRSASPKSGRLHQR
ncbi:MAG TPA: 4'-phosphopantetheinyl transferase superfamily protein [Stellaceae bacterium]|nr:4'-phosphopantetheinyl transferase superfamily protein [Stellaceae bacterium]